MRKLFLFFIAISCGGTTLPLYIDTETQTVVSPDAPTTLAGYGITDAGLPDSDGSNYFLYGDGAGGWTQNAGTTAQTALGVISGSGGGQIGNFSSTDSGASIGVSAFSSSGGAVGNLANADQGGAVGDGAFTTDGFSGGDGANSDTGGAAGLGAFTTDGGAVGNSASSTDGFAGGSNAVADEDGAVQLGTGTNSDPNTIQFRDSGPVTAAQFGALAERKTGFVDYNDTTGQISITADTWTDVPNNAAGAFTNTAYKPTSVTSLIDTNTGYLDFSDLTLGSEILIRNDFSVNPQTNNSLLEVRYLLGTGAGEYQLLFWSERLDSGSGIDYQRVTNFPIYMGDLNTRDNPGKLQVRLSTSGTLTNAGSYISIRVY